MPVTFERGDIFASIGVHGFAHGCNCAGAMGKGIAVSFRERWPAMFREYRQRCKSREFGLGDLFVWEEGGDIVFNLGTQQSWTTKAELWAVEKGLVSMLREAEQRGIDQIAMPRIGAGLGGLDWSAVRAAIERLASASTVHLRVCDIYVAGAPLATA